MFEFFSFSFCMSFCILPGGPYPSSLKHGINYTLSVYAKAATTGTILDLAPLGLVPLDPSPNASLCTLTTSWQKCSVVGMAQSDSHTSVSRYSLKTAGVAWLDMLEVTDINDCPSNLTSGQCYFIIIVLINQLKYFSNCYF